MPFGEPCTEQRGAEIARGADLQRDLRWEKLDEEVSYGADALDRAVVAEDQIRTVIRTFRARLFTEIFPGRTDPIELTMGPSPYLQMGRIDVPAALEEEFNDWYNWAYIPTYLTVPGVIRARRFVAVDAQPRYLTVYEFERPDVPESEAWSRARESNPWTRRIRPHMRLDPGSPAVYRRLRPDLKA